MSKKAIFGTFGIMLSGLIPVNYNNVIPIESQFSYKICGSGNSEENYRKIIEVKNQIIQIYEQITENVDSYFINILLENNINLFAYEEGIDAYLNEKIVCLNIGEGKGIFITGNFEKVICGNQVVETKYFIVDVLDKLLSQK